MPAIPNSTSEVQEEFQPTGRSLVAATVAVTATYVYFLIFAQFGFLKSLAAHGTESGLLRPIMAVMGLAGIAGSVGLARFFVERRGREQLMTGFLIAGAAAGLTWLARSPAVFFVCAALTGAGTGMMTVGLAGLLRREVGGERLGRCIGIGTGLAYAFCNLPTVFAAGAQVQVLLGVVAAGVGLIAVQLFEQGGPWENVGGHDYSPKGMVVWTGIFLVLVWLDSATFSIIQQTPELKLATWTETPQLWLNAGVHLGMGVVAGHLLDRRWVAGTVGAGAAALILAVALLNERLGRSLLTAGLYTAGVSLYSVALVFYPARSGRVGLAALVYAVAGWIGSALGIGMAQDLHRVPGWFLGLAGGLLVALFFIRWQGRRS